MSWFSRRIGNIFDFVTQLGIEVSINGKLLVGYLLQEFTWLNDYPGLVQSLNELVADPSPQNWGKFLIQAAMLGASGHRIVKILSRVFYRVSNLEQ